ncbi:glycosyltransferase [Halosegnis sp.]|uniref:glycosyltransferase n=1 Tax=Halosegnis sp. TaxID=2864959 RepID=UPI0035D43117
MKAIPEPPFTDPCIIHRPITFHGGGEHYAGTLAEGLDAPIYTLRQTEPLEQDVEVIEFGDDWDRYGWLLNRLPFRSLLFDAAYSSFEVPKHHDAVITTGDAPKSVIHEPHQQRYHLLHAPRRWLFESRASYAESAAPIRWIKRMARSYLRTLDTTSTARIDDFVVNSEVIGRRLETYYRRASTAVIYPPIDTDAYYHEPSEGFLLSLGRLEPGKRVQDVVKVVNNTDYQLKIAGTGSAEADVRAAAGPNVDVLGYVSEADKYRLLAECDAVVFNAEQEDFGIVPVEAFASGKPVVGVAEGFTPYQIEPGVNGVLYERGADNLRAALDRLSNQEWGAETIQETAMQFDTSSTLEQWRALLAGEA